MAVSERRHHPRHIRHRADSNGEKTGNSLAGIIGLILTIFFIFQWGNNALDLLSWILGIVGIGLFSTFLLQRFVPGIQSWYLFSVWETKRFNPQFDRFKKAKWLEIATEIGAVFGFGAIAIDYFWGRKLKSQWQRVLLFIVSVAVLATIFGLVLGNNISSNPLAKGPVWTYQLFFGLFGLSGFLLVGLFWQGVDSIIKIFAGQQACPGIAPIIPGVQTPNVPLFVPVEAWVSLVAILIIHEASHGFLMRRHGIQVQSSGLLLGGFLPFGAFVKQDEEEMKKLDKRKQIHIMSAGPSSNLFSFLAIGVIAVLLAQFVIAPTVGQTFSDIQKQESLGVKITAVDQNFTICGDTFSSPAYGKIQPGSNILKINDRNVSTLAEAIGILGENPGKPRTFLLEKDGHIYQETIEPNAIGRLGIQLEGIPNPAYSPPQDILLFAQVFGIIASIVFWFILLSLFVAIANFLPVDPLDGGRIAKYMVAPYFGFLQMSKEDTERFVGRMFVWILLPLIIANVLPLFL